MLVTQQPVLRRFWYPVMPLTLLDDGQPQPFTLLGERLVLWLDAAGEPVALADRCCHRTAQLSRGWLEDGAIVCGYHGWRYDSGGRCVLIPQQPQAKAERIKVPSFHARARYGYAWVCLDDDPLNVIPEFPEASDPAFRFIPQFYEPWDCAGLRVMENSFDNAHFSFVHRDSFGQAGHPEPSSLTITDTDSGFLMETRVPVNNPELQKKLLNMDSDVTERHMLSHWYMPFARKLQINYPNGLIHSIVTAATPIDDARSMICQFAFRNDSEADAPAADIIAFDRQVTLEDRAILETTDYDVPLATEAGYSEEQHMPSDKPGLAMRQKLLALLNGHGEREVRRSA